VEESRRAHYGCAVQNKIEFDLATHGFTYINDAIDADMVVALRENK
jgi:hypothetical protein